MMPITKNGKEYCGFCEEIVVISSDDNEDVVWFTHYSHCRVIGHVFRTLSKFMKNEINGQTGQLIRTHISNYHKGDFDV